MVGLSPVLTSPFDLLHNERHHNSRSLLMGVNSTGRARRSPLRPPPAAEVTQMGDLKYVSLLCRRFSPRCRGYEPRARGVLIKGVAPVLNSLLLERPAFISLAQQTTDTHRRLWARTRLHSHTFTFGECVFVRLGSGPQKLKETGGSLRLWKPQPDWEHLSVRHALLLTAGSPGPAPSVYLSGTFYVCTSVSLT